MSNQNKRNREYLVAIHIVKGIITLVDIDGQVRQYRQRGIKQIKPHVIKQLITSNKLADNWIYYKELPSHYSIYFEDEEIQGKAKATFPDLEKLKRL